MRKKRPVRPVGRTADDTVAGSGGGLRSDDRTEDDPIEALTGRQATEVALLDGVAVRTEEGRRALEATEAGEFFGRFGIAPFRLTIVRGTVVRVEQLYRP